jgi:hypothetical protein
MDTTHQQGSIEEILFFQNSNKKATISISQQNRDNDKESKIRYRHSRWNFLDMWWVILS